MIVQLTKKEPLVQGRLGTSVLVSWLDKFSRHLLLVSSLAIASVGSSQRVAALTGTAELDALKTQTGHMFSLSRVWQAVWP